RTGAPGLPRPGPVPGWPLDDQLRGLRVRRRLGHRVLESAAPAHDSGGGLMDRAGIVLQARLGSTRLPGKVLAPIGRWTLLEHCVRRLAFSGLPVVVATTTGAEDDFIASVARRHGAEVFRGAAADVLARFI